MQGERDGLPRAGGAARRAAGAAALALLAACSSLDARIWNLRELHASDPSQPGVRVHRRRAATVGDFEWYLRRFTSFGGEGLNLQGKEDEVIEDPYGDCLENLIRLARYTGSARAAAAQTEFFTWLAVEDDYALSRERCALELGRSARRLGVVERPEPRADTPRAPTPGELSDVLGGLVGATDRGGEGGRRAALRRATDAVRALDLDLASARRVLAIAGVLLDRGGRANPDFAPLVELEREVGRSCTVWALAAAVRDPDPRVRAAGLGSCAVLGTEARDELWFAALRDPSEEVRHEVLELVAEHGIPAEAGARREAWIAALIEKTHDLDGAVEIAACETLGTVAEAGFESCRAEDWWGWWDEHAGPEVRAREAGPAELPAPEADPEVDPEVDAGR